jgi:RHS repeat-associated protein
MDCIIRFGAERKYSYLVDGGKASALKGNGEGLVYRSSLIYRRALDGTLSLESAAFAEGMLTPAGVYYHVTDHLGSVRAVVDGESGVFLEAGKYDAYGSREEQMTEGASDATLRWHFTGKEDQGPDFGTAYTDFGARQYSPALRRWLVPDPLSEKYYDVSPYVYCNDNPVNMVDPDGRDGKVTGSGTKSDPFVIVAVYLYDSSISLEQLAGLNAAIADYNQSGITKVKDSSGNAVYVSFNLSSQFSDNPKEDRITMGFKDINGNPRYFGNIVESEELDDSGRYGYATMMEIGFSEAMIQEGITKGMNASSLYKGVAIHEIGHNLGGEHEDATTVMQSIDETITNSTFDGNNRYSVFSYPSFSKSFVKRIFNKRDLPRKDGSARIWTAN